MSIGIQLCDALEALHSAGIVHRDVKPENIMLQPDGSVKLFDYDAARVYNVLAGRDTTLMGTVGYAAPEQFGLTQSDARSDIYSLGVLLNLLLTDAHPSVCLCRGALRPIVLRCTHVNPERRYQSVRSVRRRLTLMQNRGRLLTCAVITAAVLLLLTVTALYRHMPAPTPASETVAALPMPMGFTDQTCSVQSYALDGVNYTLIISMDGQEMYAPDIKSNTRHFYLPEYETTPLFVYVIPEDGSAESIRRYYKSARLRREGSAEPGELQKQELLMHSLGIKPEMRSTVLPAQRVAEATGEPAVAIELPDGRIVTGKTSALLGASSAALLNALKALGGIPDEIKLIAPAVIEPIQNLKVNHMGNRNPRLHTNEVLIALAICAATNPTAATAIDQIDKLRGCEAHSSVILSQVDENVFNRLGMNITFDPVYQTNRLYHN